MSFFSLEQKWFKFVKSSQIKLLAFFLIALISIFFLSVTLGSFDFNLRDLLSRKSDSLDSIVLFEIRIPRVLLAAFVGASLGISGASLQGLFRNPLADPGLIGVSAGAALGASFVIVVGSSFFPEFIFGTFILPFSAIIGASFVISLLYIFTQGFGYQGITYMLLVGIAVNAFASVGIGNMLAAKIGQSSSKYGETHVFLGICIFCVSFAFLILFYLKKLNRMTNHKDEI